MRALRWLLLQKLSVMRASAQISASGFRNLAVSRTFSATFFLTAEDLRNLSKGPQMNHRLGILGVLLSSSILVACGGSSGTASDASAGEGPAQDNPLSVGGAVPTSPPPMTSAVNPELSKYEGIWRKDCVDHMRLIMTATATGTNTFSVTRNEQHFANADCTGDIVANGNYGVTDETVQYTTPIENASVQMLAGTTIVTSVDPGNSVLANARFNFTGSGVLTTEFALGTTFARIKYAEKEVVLSRGALSGQSTSGALLLLNGELLSLVAIENSTASFRVNQRYIR